MPRQRRAGVLAFLVLLFAAGHLPFLAPSLEDVDSVNFALGIRDFDPARYRPHPPGYPVYIALGKLATGLTTAAGYTPATVAEATALAALSALFGALAIVPLFVLFVACERSARVEPSPHADLRALVAVVVTIGSPLYWFAGVRPLSDLPGLAITLLAQAALAAAFVRQREARRLRAEGSAEAAAAFATAGRFLVLGAFVAAIAIGLRSQAVWLTLPLLGLVLIDRTGRGAASAWLGAGVSFGAGALLWLVPLVWATGGPQAYLAVLQKQASEDVVGVQMLLTSFSPRLLAFALWRTVVQPWGVDAVGVAVAALAAAGALVLLVRAPRAVLLVAAAAAPYAVFHLLYQETETTRYALPLVPFAAYLATSALSVAGRGVVVGVAVAAAGLWVAVPATVAFSRTPSPIVRAIAEVEREVARVPGGRVGMHFVFVRSLEAEGVPLPTLPAPDGREWLEVVRHWREGGGAPVWFLADPVRTDLALFDPGSRRVRSAHRWPFDAARVMGYVRPGAVDCVEMQAPGWFLAEGWSLTPQTAGVARSRDLGPHRAPIVGYVQRRDSSAVMLVGGRNLGAPGDPAMRVSVSLDGLVTEAWDVAPGFFVRTIELPAGRLSGAGYAELLVSAVPPAGRRAVPVAIEQFDLQSAGERPIWAFGEGWHELEWHPAQQRLFRWSSAAAVLHVLSGGADIVLAVSGESPLRYFDAAPTLVVRAGAERLSELTPLDDFTWQVRVPAAALERAGGRVTLTTTRTFAPAERSNGSDERRLGVRFYDVGIARTR